MENYLGIEENIRILRELVGLDLKDILAEKVVYLDEVRDCLTDLTRISGDIDKSEVKEIFRKYINLHFYNLLFISLIISTVFFVIYLNFFYSNRYIISLIVNLLTVVRVGEHVERFLLLSTICQYG